MVLRCLWSGILLLHSYYTERGAMNPDDEELKKDQPSMTLWSYHPLPHFTKNRCLHQTRAHNEKI